MTRGLGLSIGTARAIAVSMSEDGTSTVSRRSTLTFGTQSTVRLGDDPGGEGVVADLAHRPGEVRVAGDGYRYTGEDLIAAAAYCLVAEANPPEDVPIVLTTAAAHPRGAGNTLRTALDRAGLGRVGLVAEPVAAVACLEFERGPLGDGLALVCNVDAGSLDLTVVAIGTAWRSDPIVGRPLRFDERCATSPVTNDRIPTLELVADCLSIAEVTCDDLDVIVVSGESAADSTVMQSLSQLGRPILSCPEPGSMAARGAAALAAASSMDDVPAATSPRNPWPRRVAIASVAAAVVLAMPLLTRGSEPDPVITSATSGAPGLGVRLVEQSARPHVPPRRMTRDAPTPPAAVEESVLPEDAFAAVVPIIVRAPVAVVPAALPASADTHHPDSDSTTSTTAAAPSRSPAPESSFGPKSAPHPEPPVTPDPTTQQPEPDPTAAPETPEPTPTDESEPDAETSVPSTP
ncbi:hypothetical protein [Rhodococcus oxybenzonivorans]|nr:hypothetical protein [Rhodococcus oxybenzonivorans]